MSATLRDLGPADKRKVAHLIEQVVDKERTIRELEVAAAAAAEGRAVAAAGQGQGGPRAAQLADRNLELARENTSLRAKLSHAFDLLRTYQLKCRVLAAAAQLTGPRPATPRGGLLPPPRVESAAGGGIDTQQLTSHPGMLDGLGSGLACTGALEEHSNEDAQGAGGLQQAQQPPQQAPPPPPQQAPPSPPQQAPLQQQQQVLPQLETLKLLAQALLEAQAEVAANQRAQPAAAAAAAAAAAMPRLPCGSGALLFDASLGPHGGFLISPQPGSSECSSSSSKPGGSSSDLAAGLAPAVDDRAMQAAELQRCSGVLLGGQAAGRAPLSDLQHPYHHRSEQQQQQQQQQQNARQEWPSSQQPSAGLPGRRACWPLFDDSLSDLVRDVENMMQQRKQQQQQQQSSSAALEQWSGGWGGSGNCGGSGGVSAWRPGALYEENDLLDLIAQL